VKEFKNNHSAFHCPWTIRCCLYLILAC